MHTKGFTLIELMIVVVVIGILASIGIPTYNDYVIRGKLVQATAGLSAGRIRMEQYFQDNRTYVDANCQPAAEFTEYFSFDCGVPTQDTYTITATGIPSNLTGFSYTINQKNEKTSTTPWGNSTTCWITNKGASC